MITKDEEQLLPQCLDSVKKYVDEIIIVDTGSTDHTCEIAQQYHAKVYHQPWENHFSKARNYGLKKAKGDWILFLDADETLENGENLSKLILQADKDVEGYLFHILNYSDEAKTQIEKSISLRLFRNKPELFFSGAIHEQLPIEGKKLAVANLSIHHYGYIPFIINEKEKSKRNFTILHEELKRQPKEPFLLYNLGNEYLRIQKPQEAILNFTKAINYIDGDNGFEARLYKLLILSYLRINNWNDGLNTARQAIRKFPDYPDLYFVRGLLYEGNNELNLALKDFFICLDFQNKELSTEQFMYVIEEGITSFKSLAHIGRVYSKLGNYQEALVFYSKAINSSLTYLVPFIDLKNWYSVNPTQLVHFLEQTVLHDEFHVSKRIEIAQIFLELKAYELVIALLHEKKEREYQPQINWLLGISNFKQGQFEEASQYFSSIKQKNSSYEKAIPFYAASLWSIGKINNAKQLLGRSNQPEQYYYKTIYLLLHSHKEILKKATEKYPESEWLKEEYNRNLVK